MAVPHFFRLTKIRFTVLAFALGLLLAGCATAPVPTKQSRAGIIVQHASGELTTRCISFEGEEIDGEALLNLSNIPFIVDVGNSLGSIVCSIDGEGCLFPEDDCFCECSSLEGCSYWSYFIMNDDQEWIYAPVGARMRAVRDGDLDAWVWVSSDNGGADPGPPDLQFEDICGA